MQYYEWFFVDTHYWSGMTDIASAPGPDCIHIMISGPRNTSKACFVQKLSIALFEPTLWLAALASHRHKGLHVSVAYISCTNIVTIASLLAIACKHVLVSTAKALQRSSTLCGWVYSQSREWLFSLAGFFYAIEFTRTAMNSHFALKCDYHAMVNSLAMARIATSTCNLQLSSLRLYGFADGFARNGNARFIRKKSGYDGVEREREREREREIERERERERDREVGVGSDTHQTQARKRTGSKAHIELETQECADFNYLCLGDRPRPWECAHCPGH